MKLYKRKRIDGKYCVYCGELATTVEHFPPKSLTIYGLLLPCCFECNVLLSKEVGIDFDERCLYLKQSLIKRYKKFLKSPDWDKDEIKQLKGIIKQQVEEWEEMKERIKKRIAWNVMSYIACIDHSNYFVKVLAKINITIELEKDN